MNMIKQRLSQILTFIAIVCSSWYYFYQTSPMLSRNMEEQPNIDATIKDLTVEKFNADGILVNKLTTPLLQHFPKKNLHFLQTPHITVIQDNAPPWEISSLTAKSLHNGEKIIFQHQVVVRQSAGPKTQPSVLNTERITYYPKEKKATTTSHVSYKQLGTQIDAKGMIAYLDEQRVELLHEARGIYVPDNKG